MTATALQEKLRLFNGLYGGFSSRHAAASGDANDDHTERTLVHNYINNMYLVSSVESQRMRASELYKQIETGILLAYTTPGFTRRLTGYLRVLGLTKKR